MGYEIEGWTFFRTVHVDARDAGPEFYVVRDDGTVVTDDPAAGLGQIARSMDVLDREDPPVSKLARAAVALLTNQRPVEGDEVDRWAESGHQPGADVRAPGITRTNGGLVLTAWTRSTGRGIYFTELEVTIAPGYEVEWEEHHPEF